MLRLLLWLCYTSAAATVWLTMPQMPQVLHRTLLTLATMHALLLAVRRLEGVLAWAVPSTGVLRWVLPGAEALEGVLPRWEPGLLSLSLQASSSLASNGLVTTIIQSTWAGVAAGSWTC